MRNPDILKQTNFQSRIIPIDFAGYPERIMLAGCPVNAKGQFANDGSAIGILVEDVDPSRRRRCRSHQHSSGR